MTRGLTLLFAVAVAGGIAVGNLYSAQPLLDLIADDLHAPPARPAGGWAAVSTAGIALSTSPSSPGCSDGCAGSG